MLQLQHEVAQYLQTSGIGSIGLTLFEGTLPSTPRVAVAVVAQGGNYRAGDPWGDGATGVYRVSLQVLCRNTAYITAAQKAEAVFAKLHGTWNVLPRLRGPVNADHFPGPMYRDDNNDFVFSLNFSMVTVATTL